ncbi:MAG: phosphate signaling complex protein PhoU [Chloroflexi bacterium]|nr:phosphate signaling complex protein PhoU [Chloroflexota bacterium]
MPRESFEQELDRLQDELLVLGSMVDDALAESVDALVHRDLERAQLVMDNDRTINEKRFAEEEAALVLIATQQPMASDLRTIAAVLEITTELERIGDYAKGIAKVTLLLGDEAPLKPLVDIPLMAEKARSMLRRSLDAFVTRDVDLARSIPAEDDEVDSLYNRVYRDLMDLVVADVRNVDKANFLLWVAHNLERAADRVINICERVVFTVTGRMQEMDVGDGSGMERIS